MTDEQLAEAAKKFYGEGAFSRAKAPEKLITAYSRLIKAIEYEEETGKERMMDMSFKLALKNETEAFGDIAASVAA